MQSVHKFIDAPVTQLAQAGGNPEIHLDGMAPYCDSHHEKDESSLIRERIPKEHRLKVA